MHRDGAARDLFILALTAYCVLGGSLPSGLAQGGSGGAGAGAGGGSGSGGGSSSAGSAGLGGGSETGRPVVPRGKGLDAPSLNPQVPNIQSQQRDRAKRLEQQLRHGEVNPTTPQTEMSDRLDQFYKTPPTGEPAPRESGK
jgi:hypothetical protein